MPLSSAEIQTPPFPSPILLFVLTKSPAITDNKARHDLASPAQHRDRPWRQTSEREELCIKKSWLAMMARNSAIAR
jgi:hypothetical protein